MTITVAAMAPPHWGRSWRAAAILCTGTLVGSFIAGYAFFNVFLSSRILMYSQIGHYASPATKGFHRRWIILKDARVATIDDGYYSAEF